MINAKNCDNVYNAHLQIYVYQNKPLNDRWIRVGPPTLKGSRSWPSPWSRPPTSRHVDVALSTRTRVNQKAVLIQFNIPLFSFADAALIPIALYQDWKLIDIMQFSLYLSSLLLKRALSILHYWPRLLFCSVSVKWLFYANKLWHMIWCYRCWK